MMRLNGHPPSSISSSRIRMMSIPLCFAIFTISTVALSSMGETSLFKYSNSAVLGYVLVQRGQAPVLTFELRIGGEDATLLQIERLELIQYSILYEYEYATLRNELFFTIFIWQ